MNAAWAKEGADTFANLDKLMDKGIKKSGRG
jgi:hypothetical protein